MKLTGERANFDWGRGCGCGWKVKKYLQTNTFYLWRFQLEAFMRNFKLMAKAGKQREMKEFSNSFFKSKKLKKIGGEY